MRCVDSWLWTVDWVDLVDLVDVDAVDSVDRRFQKAVASQPGSSTVHGVHPVHVVHCPPEARSITIRVMRRPVWIALLVLLVSFERRRLDTAGTPIALFAGRIAPALPAPANMLGNGTFITGTVSRLTAAALTANHTILTSES